MQQGYRAFRGQPRTLTRGGDLLNNQAGRGELVDPNLFTPERLTIITILAGIIFSGAKRIWVWGYQLEEVQQRAARWEQIALKALKVGEAVVKKANDDLDN